MTYNENLSDSNFNNKDELSLKGFIIGISSWFHYIRKKWLIILIVGILGGILGWANEYLIKPVYTAECTFVLEDSGSSAGGLSQYAGLASMVGIDLGGSGNGIFEGDNILELYRSKYMLRKTLLSTYSSNGKKEMLIDRYIRFNNFDQLWENKSDLSKISFNLRPGEVFSRLQDSIINKFVKKIGRKNLSITKPDKKLSIIKVVVSAKDEVFAKSFNDILVKNVNDFYILTRTEKSLINLSIIKHQTDSVRAILNGAIFESARTLDATPNLNTTRQVLRAPMQRSQFNAEANKAILSELIKNQELAKLTFRREVPLIKIVDQPIFPLESTKIETPLAILTGSLLSIFLIILFYSIKRFYKKIMNTK